jgi:hypothetical protein
MRWLFVLAMLFLMAVSLSPLSAQKGKDPIVGAYDWHNGNVAVFKDNHTATSGNQSGKWTINPYIQNGYVLMWEGGFGESMRLLGRGRNAKLEGTGVDADGKSYPCSGTRK